MLSRSAKKSIMVLLNIYLCLAPIRSNKI